MFVALTVVVISGADNTHTQNAGGPTKKAIAPG